MSRVFHRMMLYACATVLLLHSLHTTHNQASAAPASWSEKSPSQKMAESKATYLNLVQAMLNRLQDSNKDKRARADGGFFSRHDAMSDYLQSAYANSLAMDPYGPGKRK
ncbi:uncharacterized protein LOC143286500 [Babylonia areolata]|uniref:uncharacterized protein LOC143286500 n=1 Tax=Babylonia areolata TaxID=304850 RepID=UPI003FD285E1